MKILSPLNHVDELPKLIQAGCDEIFLGILSSEWERSYTNVASINRREWKSANLTDYKQLEDIVSIAHKSHIDVFVTLNALYTDEQYPQLMKEIYKIMEYGTDALIVADVGLLLYFSQIKELREKIHISTGGTTFNFRTALFYKELGASRVILPRQFTIDEIKRLSKKIKDTIEVEIFILNSGCRNIDGFCTFHHGLSKHDEGALSTFKSYFRKVHIDRALLKVIKQLPTVVDNMFAKTDIFRPLGSCCLNYEVQAYMKKNKKTANKNIAENVRKNFNSTVFKDSCAACVLFDLKDCGISSLKIVGRDNSTEKTVNDIMFIKHVRDVILKKEDKKENFARAVKNAYRDIYKINCYENCYYY